MAGVKPSGTPAFFRRLDSAERLRPRRVDEFEDTEAMRRHLISVLREARMQERQGAITDFTARQDETETPFVRLGKGSIGGKGRGIAFVNAMIVNTVFQRRKETELRVEPKDIPGIDNGTTLDSVL